MTSHELCGGATQVTPRTEYLMYHDNTLSGCTKLAIEVLLLLTVCHYQPPPLSSLQETGMCTPTRCTYNRSTETHAALSVEPSWSAMMCPVGLPASSGQPWCGQQAGQKRNYTHAFPHVEEHSSAHRAAASRRGRGAHVTQSSTAAAANDNGGSTK